MAKIPPMLRQYREIKARFPDALVMFRLGDFYELFDQDAQVAARELDLVLTSRSFSKEIRLPMCGVPYRSVMTYVGRLIERGYKIALVEQVEDARRAKRLIRRDVVRVITPGTVVEDSLLQEKANNYLAALVPSPDRGERLGLAAVDLSTGEFVTCQFEGPEAWDEALEEVGRLMPPEIVLPRSLHSDAAVTEPLRALGIARVSPVDDDACEPRSARETLCAHFGVRTLQGFGCEDLPWAQAAAGALLSYLQQNQLGEPTATGAVSGGSGLAHITDLQTYHPGQYMALDAATRRNLEILAPLREGARRHTLFHTLDYTRTAMGARLLKRWLTHPLLDLGQINERLDAVGALVQDTLARDDLRRLLDGLYDLERLAARIGFGAANARDLVALRRSLERIPNIRRVVRSLDADRWRALEDGLDDLEDVVSLIARSIVERPPILVRDGGLIRRGFDAQLDELRERVQALEARLSEIEARERERTGIKTLRIRYNEVFGFFIEVPRSKAEDVPAEYERRATITHAERFVTDELKRLGSEILQGRDQVNDREYALFLEVRERIAGHAARLVRVARVLAEIDVLASLAEAAVRHGYVRPEVADDEEITIREGRHPVVERLLPDGERFVPNDLVLDGGQRLIVLTGPNMSGKSVYIRQAALIVLLAQIGSYVPAREAHIGLVDRIFVRAGASDDIAGGRSTFLVEMAETAGILRHATPRSLIVLDEVGRGTSTYDGISIAWAVAEEIHNVVGARCLFATHYHELTALEDVLASAANWTMAIAERDNRIVFLHQVVRGGAQRSFGIHVARLAGLPERTVRRAEEILARLEDEQSLAGPVQPVTEHHTVRDREELVYQADVDIVHDDAALAGISSEAIIQVLRQLLHADIGNLTPVKALLLLNDLQQRLRGH
ncbi:MAG: DNA mismatch repair protein MutS [Anaerolineae bacterium]